MEHKAEKVWKDLIWQDEKRMHGAPCIYGTRITIQGLFDWLADGGSLDEFLLAFPTVPRERAVGILRLAEQGLLKDLLAA
jgi:uncharacterized protein (DUF433 family)